MRRRLGVLVVAAALVAAGGGACSGDGGDGGRNSGGLERDDVVGDTAPDITFTRFDGTEGSLDDYDGKPVVLNWYSSTCVPCVEEMPALEKVHQRYRPDVAFLGMNTQDTVESGRAFAEATGVTYDLARDPSGDLLAEFEGIGLPTTVMISADRRIVVTHTGKLGEDEFAQLIEEELLA